MSSHTDLQGLRVAVTGGTSGLGLALVQRLKASGARVAFVARTAAAVQETAWDTATVGIVGDVSRNADIHPIALQVTANLGGLDVLINNASSLGPVPLALLADTDCEDLERALAVNVARRLPPDQGAVRRARRVRPRRPRRGRGQRLQRRRGQCLSRLGRLRRQQGRACAI